MLRHHSIRRTLLATAGLLTAGWAASAAAQGTTVAAYHNTPDHAGVFTAAGVTDQTAPSTTLDTGFNGTVAGVINAAPLYWNPTGSGDGTLIVATDSNVVAALNATTGAKIWSSTLGPTFTRTGSQCGNITPIGITGTPVIDSSTGTLYADAVVAAAGGNQRHMVYALSLATGAVLPGWPVAVGTGVTALGQPFDDTYEEQRGALALVAGQVYIPFGGYDGDCGDYHGIVAGISTTKPAVAGAFETQAQRGGIWAPGGIVSDGSSLFVATGNTASTTRWSGGEAIIHLPTNLKPVVSPANYFSPRNWHQLDNEDYDLGGTNVTLVDVPGSSPSSLALGLGKDGDAYLVNRASLGGISNALQTLNVSDQPIRSATARYAVGGSALVVVNAHSTAANCSSSGEGVLALNIGGASPKVAPAWCAPLNGRGAPVVTTTDGTSNPIVWIAGAEGDEELHAFDGVTGKTLYSSAALPTVIPHFSTLLVANGRVYVPGNGQIFAFKLGGAP